MIQQESRLNVADNSGAKSVLCISVLGGSKKKYATIGDKIVVAVKSALPSGDIKNRLILQIASVRYLGNVAVLQLLFYLFKRHHLRNSVILI